MWFIASEENIDYLAHHGVKGMKWGRRKNKSNYSLKKKIKKAGLTVAQGANYASGTMLKGLSKASDAVLGDTKVTKTLSSTSNEAYDTARLLNKKKRSI